MQLDFLYHMWLSSKHPITLHWPTIVIDDVNSGLVCHKCNCRVGRCQRCQERGGWVCYVSVDDGNRYGDSGHLVIVWLKCNGLRDAYKI